MNYDPASGRFENIHFIPSPNCDARPPGTEIDTLVIHAISLPPGEFGGPGIEQLFKNILDPEEHPYYREIVDLRVSAHLLVRRDGEMVQFVPLNSRAWHAGVSICEGREGVNDFSIGIELEGGDDQAFEEIQYQRLADVTQTIMKYFPAVTKQHIYGHADIAPGRKTDPGPRFDWSCYLNLCP